MEPSDEAANKCTYPDIWPVVRTTEVNVRAAVLGSKILASQGRPAELTLWTIEWIILFCLKGISTPEPFQTYSSHVIGVL